MRQERTGQKTRRSRVFPPHTLPRSPTIFLTTPLSYGAVALHLGPLREAAAVPKTRNQFIGILRARQLRRPTRRSRPNGQFSNALALGWHIGVQSAKILYANPLKEAALLDMALKRDGRPGGSAAGPLFFAPCGALSPLPTRSLASQTVHGHPAPTAEARFRETSIPHTGSPLVTLVRFTCESAVHNTQPILKKNPASPPLCWRCGRPCSRSFPDGRRMPPG